MLVEAHQDGEFTWQLGAFNKWSTLWKTQTVNRERDKFVFWGWSKMSWVWRSKDKLHETQDKVGHNARHISSVAVYRFVMNSVSNLLLSTYDCRFISQECSYKFIDTSELCQGEIHKILWTCMDLKAHVRNNQSHSKVYIPYLFLVIC